MREVNRSFRAVGQSRIGEPSIHRTQGMTRKALSYLGRTFQRLGTLRSAASGNGERYQLLASLPDLNKQLQSQLGEMQVIERQYGSSPSHAGALRSLKALTSMTESFIGDLSGTPEIVRMLGPMAAAIGGYKPLQERSLEELRPYVENCRTQISTNAQALEMLRSISPSESKPAAPSAATRGAEDRPGKPKVHPLIRQVGETVIRQTLDSMMEALRSRPSVTIEEINRFATAEGTELHRWLLGGKITLVHLAAHLGDEEFVQYFVDHGFNPNTGKDGTGTLLQWTGGGSQFGTAETQLRIGRLLLSKNADPNAPAFNKTRPLHIAAQDNFAPFANLLLQNGAKPDHLDSEGLAALHFASLCKSRETGEAILTNHPNVVDLANAAGITALHLAVGNQDKDFVRLLRRFKARTDIRAAGLKNITALELARIDNDPEMIRLLTT